MMRAIVVGDETAKLARWTKKAASRRNDRGETALMVAVRYGDAEWVKLLLPLSDAGAVDNNGETALMAAAQRGDAACVKVLLPSGGAKATNAKGLTPLMMVCQSTAQSAACFMVLLPESDTTQKAFSGASALSMAARRGNAAFVEALIPLCNADEADAKGVSPIWHAAYAQSPECVALLARFADLERPGVAGECIWEVAAVFRNEVAAHEIMRASTLEQRERHGANCFALVKNKNSALMELFAPYARESDLRSMLRDLRFYAGELPICRAKIEAMELRDVVLKESSCQASGAAEQKEKAAQANEVVEPAPENRAGGKKGAMRI